MLAISEGLYAVIVVMSIYLGGILLLFVVGSLLTWLLQRADRRERWRYEEFMRNTEEPERCENCGHWPAERGPTRPRYCATCGQRIFDPRRDWLAFPAAA
ncbi:MAG: hypothetical protein IPM18_13745 [Phycisphaerales bacterium]|nr:hypothetical protein [Phycisphaerales bacterium]